MIHSIRYCILLLIVSLNILSCSSTLSTQQSNNDEDQDIGMGGTGFIAHTGGGLGGTGIIGEITGFGSIFVNGIEIEYDNSTPFTVDGEVINNQSKNYQLQIGDVVEVLTVNNSNHTHAQRINLRHEVIGKVASVNSDTSSFVILGQTVILPVNNKSLPVAGTMVAVAGLRINDHTIQASRVKTTERKQNLLRKTTELPFKNQATQWLLQTHMQNGQAMIQLNGTTQFVSQQEVQAKVLSGESTIKIIRLEKSATNQLKINQVIEPVNLPRGKLTPRPVQRPDIKRQRPMQMNSSPKIFNGGR